MSIKGPSRVVLVNQWIKSELTKGYDLEPDLLIGLAMTTQIEMNHASPIGREVN